MPDASAQRRAWEQPLPTGIIISPRAAEEAAERARERGMPFVAALFDAAAAAYQAANYTLGEPRCRLLRAGEAAFTAASVRSMEIGG